MEALAGVAGLDWNVRDNNGDYPVRNTGDILDKFSNDKARRVPTVAKERFKRF